MLDEKMADFSKLVQACRSYRRFDEAAGMPREVLIDLVDTARQTASGANRMPLRYRVVCAEQERAAVFVHLRWAGALKDWDGPAPGERPAGYIVICDAGGGATTAVDEGIAAQTIVLAAASAGYGACMLHAFNKAEGCLRAWSCAGRRPVDGDRAGQARRDGGAGGYGDRRRLDRLLAR